MRNVVFRITRKGFCAVARVFFLLLSFALSSPRLLYAQADAPRPEQEETLETLGSQIHTSLGSLKARCQTLTEELEEQSEKAPSAISNVPSLRV